MATPAQQKAAAKKQVEAVKAVAQALIRVMGTIVWSD